MKKQKFKLPIKIILFLVIILLAIALLIGYIWKVLTTSDFFTVKQVVVRNSAVSFDYLKGKNIFSLNLKNESWRALLGCPDCRKVRFARIFPNCVFVDFLKRQPVDRIGVFEHFWGDTRKQWVADGHIRENEDLNDHFGYDLAIGGGLNLVADLDFQPVTVEEDAETKLVRDGNGALLRRHKLHDTPRDFT